MLIYLLNISARQTKKYKSDQCLLKGGININGDRDKPTALLFDARQFQPRVVGKMVKEKLEKTKKFIIKKN